MRSNIVIALALWVGALPAVAQTTAFDAAISAARQSLGTLRVEQDQKAAKSLANDIDYAANVVRNLETKARWSAMDVRELQRRANRRPVDRYLGSDARRVSWAIQGLRRDMGFVRTDVRNLASGAVKDPELKAPAQRLYTNAIWLRNEAWRLSSDAGFARWDIARAGYQIEAWDIERDARDAWQAAQDIESEAKRLLDKVTAEKAVNVAALSPAED